MKSSGAIWQVTDLVRVMFLALVTLIALAFIVGPRAAHATSHEICAGFPIKQRISRLGGPNSFSQGAQANTIAELQNLFTNYENDLRQVLIDNGMADVADPLFSAVANGEGIGEGTVTPGDSFEWMAWRKRGKPTTTSPACLAGDESYDTFEIAVQTESEQTVATHSFTIPKICLNLAFNGTQVTDKPAMAPAPPPPPAPSCSITVSPASTTVDTPVEVNVTGTWDSITVDVIDESGATVMSVPPPYPSAVTFDKPGAYTLTGTATNEAAETATCEARVVAERVARWTIRPFVAFLDPTGDRAHTQRVRPDGVVEQSTQSFGAEPGVGISAEYHFSDRLGLEVALIAANLDSRFMFDLDDAWGNAEEDIDFTAVTIGPNFHLTPNRRVDVYAGPFIGLVNLGDANYSVLGEQVRRDFDNDLVIGAHISLGIPFSESSAWEFHAGLRYMDITAEDKLSNQEADIDPAILTLGVGRKF